MSHIAAQAIKVVMLAQEEARRLGASGGSVACGVDRGLHAWNGVLLDVVCFVEQWGCVEVLAWLCVDVVVSTWATASTAVSCHG